MGDAFLQLTTLEIMLQKHSGTKFGQVTVLLKLKEKVTINEVFRIRLKDSDNQSFRVMFDILFCLINRYLSISKEVSSW